MQSPATDFCRQGPLEKKNDAASEPLTSRLFLCLVPPRHSRLRETSLNFRLRNSLSPSSVARACNPSGGIKVVWMFGADAGPGPVVVRAFLACPFQVGSGLLGA